jgi:FkbH-like protein
VSVRYEIIIQGEPTLVLNRLRAHEPLHRFGEIPVFWSLPKTEVAEPSRVCLFFCEFVTQILLPTIQSDEFSERAVIELVTRVCERIERISALYQHIYVFDFVSNIDWRNQGYADAASRLGQFNLLQICNEQLRQRFDDDLKITTVPQVYFWRDQVPQVSKEFFIRTGSYFPLSACDLFASYICDFILSRQASRIKCICLDLDDTIWGGVAGEVDDVNELELGGVSADGRGFQHFQFLLRELRISGIYLAVVSKNPLDAVERVFAGHSEMILKTSDIAHFELGFSEKSSRVELIADRLNISLDSIMFIDDSPSERGLMKRTLPAVNVLDLPVSPAKFADTLASSRLINSAMLTLEDYERCRSFENEANFSSQGLVPLGLDSRVEVLPATKGELPRILQLINKTNQFSSNGCRLSESDLIDRYLAEDTFIKVAHVSDEFSSLGIVGIIMGLTLSDRTIITELILSCRAFGRRVENELIQDVVEELQSEKPLVIRFKSTGRNKLALDFIMALPDTDSRIQLEQDA